MVTDPSNAVNTAFNKYDSTLIDILNKHALLRLQRISSFQSDRWCDSECRDIKLKSRQFKWKYRRLHIDESLAA